MTIHCFKGTRMFLPTWIDGSELGRASLMDAVPLNLVGLLGLLDDCSVGSVAAVSVLVAVISLMMEIRTKSLVNLREV